MAVLWVKKPGGDPFRYPVGPQGIFIPRLAEALQLRASSLLLNGLLPEFSSPGYMSLAEAESYLPGLGGSADTAIPVTGEPAYGSGGALNASELADTVAQKVKEVLGPCQRELLDDIHSFQSSQTLQASKLRASHLELLRRLLKVVRLPYDDAEPERVLAAEADAADDWRWDNTPEPSQRTAYLESLMHKLQPLLSNRSVEWAPQVVAQGLLVKGLGQELVARSDELIYVRRFHDRDMRRHGAVIGIELKKNLSMASRRQGEAEFYIFSLSSHFPFVQVVTDMLRGGFAYWKKGEQDGQQLVYEKVLVGMDAVYEFLRVALNKLPSNLGQDEAAGVVLPSQLDDPQRCKLVDPVVCANYTSELSIIEGPFFDGSLDDLYDHDQDFQYGTNRA
eukprot:GHRQ01013697.1.p1 GENE.GHRQ01013697.1~~GHRQ01013697.1.p1  ORF type:complete len:392 (+),score=98.85 GHRQ01013697.1:270-1445(+)